MPSDNRASRHVAEAAGYRQVGIQPASEPIGDGALSDLVLYCPAMRSVSPQRTAARGTQSKRRAVATIFRVTLQVSVIGTNYLGATHAAGMAEFGHHVIGVDIDVDRVKTLNAGQSTSSRSGSNRCWRSTPSSGRLRFTTDYAEIADWADVHFLALGTPSGPGGAADLSQLHAAIDTLAPLLTKPTLVVGKSTVPVGTALQLEARFRPSAGR